MENVLQWLCQNAESAWLIVFFLLLLTGFSLPVSEDLLLIASGVLAGTVVPHHTIHLFLASFFGCFLSDIVAFLIGRYFGARLYATRWCSRIVSQERVSGMQSFYKKYGVFAIGIGRCIPFGFRNGIFMTAGAGKMSFTKFLFTDGIACFIFSTAIFYLAYQFGKNYDVLYNTLHKTSLIIFFIVASIAICYFVFYKVRKKITVSSQST